MGNTDALGLFLAGLIICTILLDVSVAALAALWQRNKERTAEAAREVAEKRDKEREKNREKEAKQKELSKLRGLSKYYKMNQDEVAEYYQSVMAAVKMGSIMQQSVYQKKENDWALLGGFAEGIAGPAAGVATAMNAINENKKIEAENKAAQKWGNQQKSYMDNLAMNALKKCPQSYSMDQLERKFRVDEATSPFDLMKFLHIATDKIETDPLCGSVFLTAKWNLVKNICIDGAIRAKLYDSSNKCLGCAYMVLPAHGATQGIGYLHGVCAEPVLPGTTYVIYEPIALWELVSADSPEKAVTYNVDEVKAQLNEQEKSFLEELCKHWK